MAEEKVCPYMSEPITEMNGRKLPENEYCRCNANGEYCPIYGLIKNTKLAPYCNIKIALDQHESNKSLEARTGKNQSYVQKKSLQQEIEAKP